MITSSASCCYVQLLSSCSCNPCSWYCLAFVGALVILLLYPTSFLPVCPVTVSHVSRYVYPSEFVVLPCIQDTPVFSYFLYYCCLQFSGTVCSTALFVTLTTQLISIVLQSHISRPHCLFLSVYRQLLVLCCMQCCLCVAVWRNVEWAQQHRLSQCWWSIRGCCYWWWQVASVCSCIS